MWSDRGFLEKFNLEHPIIQAPMAGANDAAMAIAVSESGGMGSLPCAMFDVAQAAKEMEQLRKATTKPYNVNFFCHEPGAKDSQREAAWKAHLTPFYAEFGIDTSKPIAAASRAPFSSEMCELIEAYQPKVVSFHFGLPEPTLIDRVKASGSLVLSSATTVSEAKWLAERGCDAIIAQGYEAGGHRGMFLSDDLGTQLGTFALLPQIADAVDLPIIAAGGIAEARGIAAAFVLGASAVQIGTAYLFTKESLISQLHHQALISAGDNYTALTNVFSGRPARGLMNRVMREVGPISDLAPSFPLAGAALAPLKSAQELQGDSGFSSLWSGQSAPLNRELADKQYNAGELTQQLAAGARKILNFK